MASEIRMDRLDAVIFDLDAPPLSRTPLRASRPGRRGDFALVIGGDRSGHARELRQRGANILVGDLGEIRVSETTGGDG